MRTGRLCGRDAWRRDVRGDDAGTVQERHDARDARKAADTVAPLKVGGKPVSLTAAWRPKPAPWECTACAPSVRSASAQQRSSRQTRRFAWPAASPIPWRWTNRHATRGGEDGNIGVRGCADAGRRGRGASCSALVTSRGSSPARRGGYCGCVREVRCIRCCC